MYLFRVHFHTGTIFSEEVEFLWDSDTSEAEVVQGEGNVPQCHSGEHFHVTGSSSAAAPSLRRFSATARPLLREPRSEGLSGTGYIFGGVHASDGLNGVHQPATVAGRSFFRR